MSFLFFHDFPFLLSVKWALILQVLKILEGDVPGDHMANRNGHHISFYQKQESKKVYGADKPLNETIVHSPSSHLMRLKHHMKFSPSRVRPPKYNDWNGSFKPMTPSDKRNEVNSSWGLNQSEEFSGEEYHAYLQGSLAKFIQNLNAKWIKREISLIWSPFSKIFTLVCSFVSAYWMWQILLLRQSILLEGCPSSILLLALWFENHPLHPDEESCRERTPICIYAAPGSSIVNSLKKLQLLRSKLHPERPLTSLLNTDLRHRECRLGARGYH